MHTNQLTFLRFVAAMGVVVFHFGRGTMSLGWANRIWDIANTAVAFFFFLSGFILTFVYSERGANAADFYVARAARILPLYLLALAGVVVVTAWCGTLRADELLLSLLLVQSWVPGYSQVLNVPGWSLSVEAFFYLIFPLLLPLVLRTRSGGSALLWMVIAWAVNLVIHISLVGLIAPGSHGPFQDFAIYHPITHALTFVGGCYGGVAFKNLQGWFGKYGQWVALAAAVGLVAVAWAPDQLLRYHHNGLFAPLFFPLIAGLAGTPRAPVSRVFASRPCELLGEVSYGVYILQAPVALVYFWAVSALGAPPSDDVKFWLLAALIVTASIASYFLVEMPSRKAVRSWWKARKARRAELRHETAAT